MKALPALSIPSWADFNRCSFSLRNSPFHLFQSHLGLISTAVMVEEPAFNPILV